MKRYISLIILSAFVMILCPVALLHSETKNINSDQNNTTTAQAPVSQNNNTITVFRSAQQKADEIDMFEYVCGSVAAEMPLSYHEEALKAQAVACYTNALRLKQSGGYSENAHISDDTSVHQGYLSEAQRRDKWGDDFKKYESKLQNAVKTVENEYICYNGEPCVAAFFALCSGTTEAAENIWGQKVSYLVSVKSSGDTLSPQYTQTVSIDKSEFINCLKNTSVKTENIKTLKNIIKVTEKSKVGTVLKAEINSEELSGEEIQKAFSLRSRVFSVKTTKDTVTFTVTGYGHGVGMSQYGADFMARQGSTYDEILSHYYQGTQINKNNP